MIRKNDNRMSSGSESRGYASLDRGSSFTAAGFAWPLLAFMTCPTRKPAPIAPSTATHSYGNSYSIHLIVLSFKVTSIAALIKFLPAKY